MDTHLCIHYISQLVQIAMKKNVGIRIRVEPELRLNFVHACKQEGRTAAEVLREFMSTYVDSRINNNQAELFPSRTDINNS